MMEEIDLSWEKYISEKIFQTISSKFSRYPIRLSNSTLCTVCTSCFTRLPLGATKSVFHAFFIAPDVVPRRNSSVGYSHKKLEDNEAKFQGGKGKAPWKIFPPVGEEREWTERKVGHRSVWWRGAGEGYTSGGILDSLRSCTGSCATVQ